jgi:hypothetical protein
MINIRFINCENEVIITQIKMSFDVLCELLTSGDEHEFMNFYEKKSTKLTLEDKETLIMRTIGYGLKSVFKFLGNEIKEDIWSNEQIWRSVLWKEDEEMLIDLVKFSKKKYPKTIDGKEFQIYLKKYTISLNVLELMFF